MRFGCDQICDHFAVKAGVRRRFVARTSEQSSRREALLLVMLTRISRRFGRGDWIRTSDPLRPREVRYQAALRPDSEESPVYRGSSARSIISLRFQGEFWECFLNTLASPSWLTPVAHRR